MTTGLSPFRDRIDALDDQIVGLLAERLAVCADVGRGSRCCV